MWKNPFTGRTYSPREKRRIQMQRYRRMKSDMMLRIEQDNALEIRNLIKKRHFPLDYTDMFDEPLLNVALDLGRRLAVAELDRLGGELSEEDTTDAQRVLLRKVHSEMYHEFRLCMYRKRIPYDCEWEIMQYLI